MNQKLRIGTRGSKLALVQANRIKNKIEEKFPTIEVVIVKIKTEGDLNQITPLSQMGGKGVFIKSIEKELLNQSIDIAVHSFKDITTKLEPGLSLAGFLQPESSADVLLANPQSATVDNIKTVGTGSLRRKALIKKYFPHWNVKPIRGNVDTRLKKCLNGEFDGIICSKAGVLRLGLEEFIIKTFNEYQFIPAPGQGTIALEVRSDDEASNIIAHALNDAIQEKISRLEMAFIQALNMGCDFPLGLKITVDDKIKLNYFCATESLTQYWEGTDVFDDLTEKEISKFAQEIMKSQANTL